MDDLTSSFPIINNRYQIHSTIASGGMAVIYLAQDLLLERKVALKILRKDFSDDQQFQNSFRAEAKASAKLSHPNIVTTYDFGYDADRLYIVMELVEGTDLKTILTERKILDFSEAMDFLLQASNGLGYAHQSGIVHCDVKPQNMLVSETGVLKITDFGIARAMDSISRDERYDVVWGSPYYLSTEQAKGLPPSPATDIYSLGVIAYEMMTGKLPFEAQDSIELARMHRLDAPIPPQQLNSAISDDLNELIMKSLSKEPEDRYPDGDSFHKALKVLKINPHPLQALISKPEEQQETANHHPEIVAASEPAPEQAKFDWKTITLSFLALILAGGLIPFWIYVLFTINK
jgi:serine/threonine protein kinase